MKEDYIASITNLLHKCEDIEIFEIILHLLRKQSLQEN